VILFHDIIQILAAADLERVVPAEVELVPHPHAAQGKVARLKAIERDVPTFAMKLQCLPKERAGRHLVAGSRNLMPGNLVFEQLQLLERQGLGAELPFEKRSGVGIEWILIVQPEGDSIEPSRDQHSKDDDSDFENGRSAIDQCERHGHDQETDTQGGKQLQIGDPPDSVHRFKGAVSREATRYEEELAAYSRAFLTEYSTDTWHLSGTPGPEGHDQYETPLSLPP
jgi:hypothetical protein